MQRLNEVKIGASVKVVKIHGDGALRRRIMDMGITKGIEIKLKKAA
ncbi:MAG: ferrous iron transport protein A, partial [Campylobacter sp.]|nr:ferrous iron transport protein A [Campylobacter sp.]